MGGYLRIMAYVSIVLKILSGGENPEGDSKPFDPMQRGTDTAVFHRRTCDGQ